LKIMPEVEFQSLLAELDIGRSTSEEAYSWELDDLYFLYRRVRQTGVSSVLEFGSGWSTFALALGLYENRKSMGHGWPGRHPNPWVLMSIDVSSQWQDVAISRLPDHLRDVVRPVVSECHLEIASGGSMVSNFSNVPAFMADLIYVDAPDPEQVQGRAHGFTFQELHSLPMVGNLIELEYQFWPGTEIIFDGRTSNARMIRDSFRRNWNFLFDPYGDRTTMRLDESSLGAVSSEHEQLRMNLSRAALKKDGIVLS
jgi:hypothetical protein